LVPVEQDLHLKHPRLSHTIQDKVVLRLLLVSYPHAMVVVEVVVTNLIQLVIMVDLVVVDQMDVMVV
tara:strand:- start:676 stop:876 length:201 start_codon:yes stop_codon:yes gene_type:complete